MADLEIIKDDTGEFMVAAVRGISDAGIEFVDAYVTAKLQAIDAGLIVIPESDLEDLLARAKLRDLTVEA